MKHRFAAEGGRWSRSAFDPPWNALVNGLAARTAMPTRVRTGLLRAAGVDCRTFKVAPGLWLATSQLEIGTGALIGWHVRIHNEAPVRIGAHAFLGPEVALITTGHEIGGPDQRAGERIDGPISVGEGAWLGARATVLGGVTIGEGCVVAAGAVVISDCEPHGLYAGVPAVRRRDLPVD